MIVLPAKDHAAAAAAAAHQEAAARSLMLLTSLSEPILPSSSSGASLAPVDVNAKAPLQKCAPCSSTLPVPDPRRAADVADDGDEVPELFDDMILEILSKLNGRNRHAVSGCCKRLRELAQPTLTHLALPIPPPRARSAPDPADAAAAAAAGARMASMTSVTLHLPALSSSAFAAAAADDDDAMDRFLSLCFSACPGGVLQADTLRIKPADGQLPQCNSNTTPCQVSHAALSRLARATPRLRRLSLPLLSTAAAAALPLFSSQLTSLSLTVSDSPSLDHALQLTSLRHLSISTRKGLLYLVLSQRQILGLAKMSSLQTLCLSNVLLNDCRTAWEPLSALTSLRELQLSSPLSAERLLQMPSSLRTLQLPFFAGSLEVLGQLDADDDGGGGGGAALAGLTELRCRQAFTEQDLAALAALPGLRTLQCDNVVVMDTAAQAAHAALGRAPDASTALPVLRSVTELRLTGFHAVDGLLGVMFPNLQSLRMAAVTVPRPVPARLVSLPRLRSLTWPSSCVLPELLLACPELSQLSVPGINCQQRLEELLHLPCPQQQQQAAAAGCPDPPARGGPAAGQAWWPAKLSELSLGFSSSVRFRPKQVVAALLAAPAPVASAVRTLSLADQAQGSGPGRVVDDAVVAAAVRALPQLQQLQLSGCGAVSGEGLLGALQEARASLGAVAVAGCPRVGCPQAERIPCALGRPWMEVTWQKASS